MMLHRNCAHSGQRKMFLEVSFAHGSGMRLVDGLGMNRLHWCLRLLHGMVWLRFVLVLGFGFVLVLVLGFRFVNGLVWRLGRFLGRDRVLGRFLRRSRLLYRRFGLRFMLGPHSGETRLREDVGSSSCLQKHSNQSSYDIFLFEDRTNLEITPRCIRVSVIDGAGEYLCDKCRDEEKAEFHDLTRNDEKM
jgi:hypothetical protein